MIEDPIVEEVRRHRQANAAKFGYSVRAIADDARARERLSGHRIVNLQDRDERRPVRAARKARKARAGAR